MVPSSWVSDGDVEPVTVTVTQTGLPAGAVWAETACHDSTVAFHHSML